jgi:hypothetical protein
MRNLDPIEAEARVHGDTELPSALILDLIAELREHRAKAPVNGGTGCEPFLLGWELRLRYRYSGGPPATLALAGAVLQGYVSCSIAIAKGVPVHNDAALAAWTRGNT